MGILLIFISPLSFTSKSNSFYHFIIFNIFICFSSSQCHTLDSSSRRHNTYMLFVFNIVLNVICFHTLDNLVYFLFLLITEKCNLSFSLSARLLKNGQQRNKHWNVFVIYHLPPRLINI